MFTFEELDQITRAYMLQEFEAEEASGNAYRSKRLSPIGRSVFPQLMANAIQTGNEATLTIALSNPRYWFKIHQDQERTLAITEFNTWYVRGLCRRLMNEGEEYCQVYRAENPKHSANPECFQHEGQIYLVSEIYAGHRRRYWGDNINPYALSIPIGPNCHHTVRRVKR